MPRPAPPLAPFRQELPYCPVWPIARELARTERGTVFLDSSCDPQAHGRWSVFGWRPKRTLRWPAGRPGALDGLRMFLGERRLDPDPDRASPFRGGYVGWIGYDIGRDIETLPDRLPVDASVPDFAIAEYETLLVEDRVEKRLFLSGACDTREGPSRFFARQAEVVDLIREGVAESVPETPSGPAAERAGQEFERAEFEARVGRVLDYIRAGDIFQANLSQRFDARLRVAPLELYRRLRAASPNPYGGWFDLGGPRVLSISPELFVERHGGVVTTRPIKGTRPRGATPDDDARLVAELEASEKDRAELAMIVDLLRNDLGRVADIGSVTVDEPRRLHAHPTVHHAEATVRARLADDVHAVDLLRATMPGGSITGAPKIRAMEILEELEESRRGPYCGSAGWIGYDGDLVLNILIRTLVVQDDRVSFRVGGGIVADSHPAAEYDETLDKAAALWTALTEPAA